MRKLKLSMHTTVDGFVAGPNGELDWMTQEVDDKFRTDFLAFTDSFDTILMGRKMAAGFMDYWNDAVKNPPTHTSEEDGRLSKARFYKNARPTCFFLAQYYPGKRKPRR